MGALGVLGLDFILFPDFVEDRIVLEALSASSLVNGEVSALGKLHLHMLRVSSGHIADEAYMRNLGPRVNALALTAFSEDGKDRAGIGAFAEAVMPLLPASDTDRLRAVILNSPTLAPGKVQVVALQKPHGNGPLSGIDHLLILRTKRGADREAKEALRSGLSEILKQAEKYSVSGLFLPTLTVSTASVAPEQKGTPTFDDFFRSFFEALRSSKSVRYIDISLFDGWSTEDLENATASFNTHWAAEIQDRSELLATLHRFQLRVLLLGLAICFVVCSRRITLRLKSSCTIAIAYALMLLGSFKTVETFTEGFNDSARTFAMLIITIVIAVGFPSFVGWSAKDLFGKARTDAHG